MPYQIEAVENLTAAIQSGSLPAARAAYSRARYPYEQMEVRAALLCVICALHCGISVAKLSRCAMANTWI